MKITVKAARVNFGMSQKDTAALLGLSLTAYSRKENGQARFYFDEIICLSKTFKMPVENFFEQQCHIKTHVTA